MKDQATRTQPHPYVGRLASHVGKGGGKGSSRQFLAIGIKAVILVKAKHFIIAPFSDRGVGRVVGKAGGTVTAGRRVTTPNNDSKKWTLRSRPPPRGDQAPGYKKAEPDSSKHSKTKPSRTRSRSGAVAAPIAVTVIITSVVITAVIVIRGICNSVAWGKGIGSEKQKERRPRLVES